MGEAQAEGELIPGLSVLILAQTGGIYTPEVNGQEAVDGWNGLEEE